MWSTGKKCEMNKVRIVCTNCLSTKIVNKTRNTPKDTRLIAINYCKKCCDEPGIEKIYFDKDLIDLEID